MNYYFKTEQHPKFHKTKDHNSQPGNSPRTRPVYEELDKVLNPASSMESAFMLDQLLHTDGVNTGLGQRGWRRHQKPSHPDAAALHSGCYTSKVILN